MYYDDFLKHIKVNTMNTEPYNQFGSYIFNCQVRDQYKISQ